jgi:hypothetical protein
MTEETQMPLATHTPIEEVTATGNPLQLNTPEPATTITEVIVEEQPPVVEPVVEETKEPETDAVSEEPAALVVEEAPVPELVTEAPVTAPIAPEPAEQVAAFTPQAPAPKDGQAPVQRLVATTSQTIVKGSEEAAKQSKQLGDEFQQWQTKAEASLSTTQLIAPVTDLKSAILQSLNPKSFFPISHILRRYFGARFASQEAAKETRVLLEQLHNSRQIIVNNNRHVQLARPFYTSATPMTQYHTLDKTPLEAMLGGGIAK